MPFDSSCNHPASHPVSRASFFLRAVMIILAFAVTSSFAFCQSPAPSQPSSSPPSQQQAQPQQSPQKKDDAADPATKKPEKDKPKPKKVFTEEDLSSLHGGLSVVGDSTASSGSGNSAGAGNGKAGGNVTPMSGQDEDYWRGRAKEILDQMAAIDQEIAKTKEDIKKYGADGFDAQTGYKNNVVYVDNRASKVEQLEKRKSDLAKQLDELQEEGRKAGADPAWFR